MVQMYLWIVFKIEMMGESLCLFNSETELGHTRDIYKTCHLDATIVGDTKGTIIIYTPWHKQHRSKRA